MKNNVARVYLLRGTKKRPPHKDGLIVLWSPVPSIPILAGVSKSYRELCVRKGQSDTAS